MEKEFVPYELALRMKALGFDEPCMGVYYGDEDDIQFVLDVRETQYYAQKGYKNGMIAPTWQSAFRWLIPLVDEEYKVCFEIDGWYIYNLENEVYEGIKSLEKLIEIVESKSE